MNSEFKLYAFQPRGHGEESFFVMADSEESARLAVDKHVATPDPKYGLPESDGWGTDYYAVTIAEAGQVVANNND